MPGRSGGRDAEDAHVGRDRGRTWTDRAVGDGELLREKPCGVGDRRRRAVIAVRVVQGDDTAGRPAESIRALDYSGAHDGEVLFEIGLESAGALTFEVL